MSEKHFVKKGINIVEGDVPLRDYNGSKDGKPVFETWDIDEWKKYALKNKLMNINGQKPCALCGVDVFYDEMPAYEKPLCPKCLENVKKYSEHVVLKGETKAQKKEEGDTK